MSPEIQWLSIDRLLNYLDIFFFFLPTSNCTLDNFSLPPCRLSGRFKENTSSPSFCLKKFGLCLSLSLSLSLRFGPDGAHELRRTLYPFYEFALGKYCCHRRVKYCVRSRDRTTILPSVRYNIHRSEDAGKRDGRVRALFLDWNQ